MATVQEMCGQARGRAAHLEKESYNAIGKRVERRNIGAVSWKTERNGHFHLLFEFSKNYNSLNKAAIVIGTKIVFGLCPLTSERDMDLVVLLADAKWGVGGHVLITVGDVREFMGHCEMWDCMCNPPPAKQGGTKSPTDLAIPNTGDGGQTGPSSAAPGAQNAHRTQAVERHYQPGGTAGGGKAHHGAWSSADATEKTEVFSETDSDESTSSSESDESCSSTESSDSDASSESSDGSDSDSSDESDSGSSDDTDSTSGCSGGSSSASSFSDASCDSDIDADSS